MQMNCELMQTGQRHESKTWGGQKILRLKVKPLRRCKNALLSKKMWVKNYGDWGSRPSGTDPPSWCEKWW